MTQTKKYTLQGVGSGFIVTGDGYLVTARHVVTADKAEKQEFARRGAADFAAQEAKSIIKAFAKYDLSNESIKAITQAVTAYSLSAVDVKVGTPKVSVILGVANADGTRTGKGQPAEVVYRSSPELQADIAILRVRQTNMPTVSMASKSLRQGAPVNIHCFPYDATFIQGMSVAAQLTPTMTAGRVTATKLAEGGINLIQTDAQSSEGCSGGAGLDDQGNVVGVLVSGAVDGNGASVGEHYLMPIDVVKDALRSSNVTPEVSLTTSTYNQALSDFSNDYYKKALEEFQQVKALYPAHPYVSQYLSESQTAITQGKDKTPNPLTIPLLVGGGVAGAAVVTAVVVLLVRRRYGSAGGPLPVQTWGNDVPAGGGLPRVSSEPWAQTDKVMSPTAPNGSTPEASNAGQDFGVGPGRSRPGPQ
jgi:hypothetical protein